MEKVFISTSEEEVMKMHNEWISVTREKKDQEM